MAKKDRNPGGELLVCRNPRATKRYEIEERLEAGMVLQGSEVKSLRQRRADLEGAFGAIEHGEAFLHKMHIAPYEQAGPYFGHEPKRKRKLLMKRHQIEKWRGKLTTRGYTIVPLAVYFKGGYAKVELGLGKGRKTHDKRHELKKQQDLRDAREAWLHHTKEENGKVRLLKHYGRPRCARRIRSTKYAGGYQGGSDTPIFTLRRVIH